MPDIKISSQKPEQFPNTLSSNQQYQVDIFELMLDIALGRRELSDLDVNPRLQSTKRRIEELLERGRRLNTTKQEILDFIANLDAEELDALEIIYSRSAE